MVGNITIFYVFIYFNQITPPDGQILMSEKAENIISTGRHGCLHVCDDRGFNPK